MLIPRELRKLLAFGTGIGIEAASSDLEVVAARVRPNGVQVAGHLVIRNFAGRPAAEWGAEYGQFLKSLAMSHFLSAPYQKSSIACSPVQVTVPIP